MTSSRNSPTVPPTIPLRSRGAALITSLVLLLILTILATAGVRTAQLELLLADHQRTAQAAFAAAEAGIELILDDVMRNARVVADPLSITLPDGTGVVASVSLKAITMPPPVSEDSEPHPDDVRAIHFEVRSDATAARGARVTHVQGFYLLTDGFDGQEACLDEACLPAITDCADLSCLAFDPARFPARTYWTRAAPE